VTYAVRLDGAYGRASRPDTTNNEPEAPMPQQRKRSTNAETEEPEAQEEEAPEEEEFDENGGGSAPGLNIDVADDRVVIELPRDGNERPSLEAIGAMLESMS
jgi:hypothetical protein